jgi:hypothetical protein
MLNFERFVSDRTVKIKYGRLYISEGYLTMGYFDNRGNIFLNKFKGIKNINIYYQKKKKLF